jgi:hypothetical protein
MLNKKLKDVITSSMSTIVDRTCYYFFCFENHAVYEIMWENLVEPGSSHMKIWGMRIAFWLPKATNTHSEYVIFFLLIDGNSGYTTAKQRHVIHTLPVLLHLTLKCQTCCGFEFSIVLGSCTSSVAALNATCSRIRTDEVMFQ